MDVNLISFLIVCTISVFSVCFSAYVVGCNSLEQQFIKEKIVNLLTKKKLH